MWGGLDLVERGRPPRPHQPNPPRREGSGLGLRREHEKESFWSWNHFCFFVFLTCSERNLLQSLE